MAESTPAERGVKEFQSQFGEWLTLPPGTLVDERGTTLEVLLSPSDTIAWLGGQLSSGGFETLPPETFTVIGFEDSEGLLKGVWKKRARTLAAEIKVSAIARLNDSGGTQVLLFRSGPEAPDEWEDILGEMIDR